MTEHKSKQEGTSDLHLLLRELSQYKYHLPKKYIKRRCQDVSPTNKPWRTMLRNSQ